MGGVLPLALRGVETVKSGPAMRGLETAEPLLFVPCAADSWPSGRASCCAMEMRRACKRSSVLADASDSSHACRRSSVCACSASRACAAAVYISTLQTGRMVSL